MAEQSYFGYCSACKPLIEEALKESLIMSPSVGVCSVLNSAFHKHSVKVTKKTARM
jgi:hypothetical protein